VGRLVNRVVAGWRGAERELAAAFGVSSYDGILNGSLGMLVQWADVTGALSGQKVHFGCTGPVT
jgi:hypothetical protein